MGFTYARGYGFRVVKDFGGKFAVGVSVEGPQSTIGGRGFSLVTTNTVGTASVTTTGNTFINAPGAGGGLYNAFDATGYTVNKAPDVLVKAAIDPGWGHYELFGIVSTFRNRVYPCGVIGTNQNDTPTPATPTTLGCVEQPGTSASAFVPSSAGAYNDTRTGGGFGISASVPVFAKKVDFGIKGVAGDGIGRYGAAAKARQMRELEERETRGKKGNPPGRTALFPRVCMAGRLQGLQHHHDYKDAGHPEYNSGHSGLLDDHFQIQSDRRIRQHGCQQ